MTQVLRYAVNMMKIRRAEFIIAEIPILGIPIALSIARTSNLDLACFIEFTLLFFLLFNVGDMVNCVCDRDIDVAQKSYLAAAVSELGVGSVLWQSVVSAVFSIVLASDLSIRLCNPSTVWTTIVALFVAISYSVPPVRFKNRGNLQLIWLMSALFILPMLFTCQTLFSAAEPLTIGIILAYAVMQTGIVLVNTAEDFVEDRLYGVNTVIVQAGLSRGLLYSKIMCLLGTFSLFPLLAFAMIQVGSPALSLTLPTIGFVLCLFATSSIAALSSNVRRQDEYQAIELVKKTARLVPLFLTAIAWCSFICSVMVACIKLRV